MHAEQIKLGGIPLRKASLARFFVFYFLFCVISNMVHPITPAYLQSINCPDYMFGVAFAAMAFTNFLSSAFWGKMGDRYGYAKIMGVGYTGYTVGQWVFSIATNSYMVVLGRAIAGLFIAGFSVNAMAYIATSTDDNQTRSKYMATYAAMMSVGAAVGFLIGGLIGDYSMGLVFNVQLVGLVFASIASLTMLGEFKPHIVTGKLSFKEVDPISNVIASFKLITPAMAIFLMSVLFTSFATQAHDGSFNYYLKAQLNLPPSANGIFKALVGTIGLVANFTINMWIVKKTDSRKSIIYVLLLCGAALVCIVAAPVVSLFLAASVVFYTFNAIYLPIQQALMIRNDDGASSGAMAGLFNATRSLGMVVGPLFSGFAFSVNPKYPFIGAGVAFFAAAVLCYYNQKQYERLESK